MINEDVRHIVEAELQPGETLLWADRPAKFPLNFFGVYSLVFSIVWCSIVFSIFGAALFGFADASSSPETIVKPTEVSTSIVFASASFLIICMSVFIGAGLFSLFLGIKTTVGPSKEVYAVTSDRIILFDRFLSSRVVSLNPHRMEHFERKGNDRNGTLSFGSNHGNIFSMNWMWQTSLNSFQKISNPREVEKLVYKTFLKKDPPHE